ncbi:MAG: VOC family protein [Pseudohongiella sp.]|nr:VOC family protein [Pseudohongiella sp.]MDP2126028.1 VOC family protein [Pseudohongiella sp.]
MQNKHGDFIWYELLTSDLDGARKFYGKILGWNIVNSDMPGPEYWFFNATGIDSDKQNTVGGMMQISSEMKAGGAVPLWLGYIGVDDVDVCIERLIAAGGTVIMPATDVPGAGRIAMVTDPQGVPFYVIRGDGDEPSLSFAADKPRPGHCAWNELASTDPAGAWTFYSSLFGWVQDGEMDMGEMGKYQFIRHGGVIGALMPKPKEMPVPMWSYYFRVVDIDAAAKAVTDNGGQVFYGPAEVPGGDFIISGMDPQGAAFNLVGAKK